MSEDIKNRIRKLLRLAENSGATEAEAASALEMASALMLKYNITVDADDLDADQVIRSDAFMQGFDESWHMACASAAAYLYMCKVVAMSRGEHGWCFIGRKENVQMAGETMESIVKQVEMHYKFNLPSGMTKSDRAEYRRTFKYACATRVYSRAVSIVETFKKSDAKAIEYTGSKALVVVASIKQQLDAAAEFIEKNMDTVPIRARTRKTGAGTWDGFKAGDKVQLNKAVK